MYKLNFYFEISAEAGLGHDIETGENARTYSKISFDFGKNPDSFTNKEKEELNKAAKKLIANQFKINENYLRLISEEEYFEKVEEDDEDSEELE